MTIMYSIMLTHTLGLHKIKVCQSVPARNLYEVPYDKKISGENIFVFRGSLVTSKLNFHKFNRIHDQYYMKTQNLLTEGTFE